MRQKALSLLQHIAPRLLFFFYFITNSSNIQLLVPPTHTHSHESAAPGRDRDNEVGGSLGSGADDDVVVSIGGTTLPVLKSDTERGRRKSWAGERNDEFFNNIWVC
jgi:hypothetical protein